MTEWNATCKEIWAFKSDMCFPFHDITIPACSVFLEKIDWFALTQPNFDCSSQYFDLFSFLDRASEVRKKDYSPTNQVSRIFIQMDILFFRNKYFWYAQLNFVSVSLKNNKAIYM